MLETPITQFNIIIYLPKAPFIAFDEVCQRLDSTFNMYQQHVVANECWYLFKNTVKVKPEELVHSVAGFTDFGLKKLSFAWKKIEKKGDTQIFLLMVHNNLQSMLSPIQQSNISVRII